MMSEVIKLTDYTEFSGCGAKLGPGLLDKALCGLVQSRFPELMIDYRQFDDAGVWRIDEKTALVQTLDFFPPIVNDPFTFGRIAAANALSDIYAMGARPITAMSIVAFPAAKMGIAVLRQIMQGALNALAEAETALIGGHSVQDDELKFGLAVTGLARPDALLRNNSLSVGDRLILTKPLGTGCINRALKAKRASVDSVNASISSMSTLNRQAAEILSRFPASACTDVTGFGLLGHACEMVFGSNCAIRIHANHIRVLPGAKRYISEKLIPEGTVRNRNFCQKWIKDSKRLPDELLNLLFDPQTSGGLLAAISRKEAGDALESLSREGIPAFEIGEVRAGDEFIEILT